jgi:hypothetical protein
MGKIPFEEQNPLPVATRVTEGWPTTLLESNIEEYLVICCP